MGKKKINNKKVLLIYHNEDNDGLFSAAIINYALKQQGIEQIDFKGANYIDMKEIEESGSYKTLKEQYENIILTDISFSGKVMLWLASNVKNFIWFDHHRPIIMESMKLGFDNVSGLRDTNHSALYNAWMYYNNPLKDQNIAIPKLYNLLSAWDSFTYEQNGYTLDTVKIVNLGTNAIYELNLDKIKKLVEAIASNGDELDTNVVKDLVTIGTVCLKYENSKNANIVATSCDREWTVDGRKAVALFMCGPSNSEMFATLKGSEFDNALVFKVTGSDKVTVSLYNINNEDDYDCGAYMLNKYKGGGHVGAAGCQISKSKFIQLLKSKSF